MYTFIYKINNTFDAYIRCIRACRQTRAALRNRKNQYYHRGFAGRASPPSRRTASLWPKIALLFLSPYFSNRINSSIDDRFAAILLLSEDLASFERTVAVIAVREIY